MVAVRPKLQNRAISEMGPLVTPPRDATKADLGEGTRAIVGGARVAAGSRLPGGALAPLSPFLPMPPAPTSEELAARQTDDAAHTPKARQELPRSRKPVPHDRNKAFNALRSAGMTRSYSTPVPTQSEYEAQCKAFAERQSMAQATAAANPTLPWSSGWPTSTSSFSARRQERRNASASTASACATSMAHSRTQQAGTPPHLATQQHPRVASKRAPLSPLAINIVYDNPQLGATLDAIPDAEIEYIAGDSQLHRPAQDAQEDSYFFPRKFLVGDSSDGSSESCSEGPATPKAVTPTHATFHYGHQYGGKTDDTHVTDPLSDLIHPDHLCPPPLNF